MMKVKGICIPLLLVVLCTHDCFGAERLRKKGGRRKLKWEHATPAPAGGGVPLEEVDISTLSSQCKAMLSMNKRPLGAGGNGQAFLASWEDIDTTPESELMVQKKFTRESGMVEEASKFSGEDSPPRCEGILTPIGSCVALRTILYPYVGKTLESLYIKDVNPETAQLPHLYSLRLPRADVVADIVAQVSRSLMCLHGAGFVHVDIKPNNLAGVFDADGDLHVTMIDIGSISPVGKPYNFLTETESETAPATMYYFTPGPMDMDSEKADEVHVGWDMGSLGITAVELLTGHLPYATADNRPVWVRAVTLLRTVDYSDLDNWDSDVRDVFLSKTRKHLMLREAILGMLALESADKLTAAQVHELLVRTPEARPAVRSKALEPDI